MRTNQKRAGVLLSYITIFANLAVNLFFLPYLINSIGENEYGIYKIASSFSGQLAIMNFGIGVIISRGIAKYNALNQKENKGNFLFMSFVVSGVLLVGMLVVGAVMYTGIDALFSKSLPREGIDLAKRIFIISVITTAISIGKDAFNGMINGNERFAVAGASGLIRIAFRVCVILLMISLGYGALAISVADLTATSLMVLFEMLYSFHNLGERARFTKWDKAEFKSMLGFAVALCLQSIINQVNMNLDSTILGAVLTENVAETVTMYSVALVILTNFGSLCGNISSVFVPQATKMVYCHSSAADQLNLIVKVGRVQMMIASCALSAFILFGKEFLYLWMGESFIGAYLPAVLLMASTMIPLVQSAVVAIMDARGKRMVRSIVLLIMALINIVSSVLLIKLFGFVGAAIGTCLSMVVGHGVIMNIYYHKKLDINVFKMFRGIFHRTLPTVVCVLIIFIPLTVLMPYSIVGFIIKCTAYAIVLFVAYYFLAMNQSEKSIAHNMLNGIKRKISRR